MTADALIIVHFLFTEIWSLFTGWYFPGTNVTPASMAFFLLASYTVIRILKNYFTGGSDG